MVSRCWVLGSLLLCGAAQERAAPDAGFRALVGRTCLDCHNPKKAKGKVDLSGDVDRDPKLWLRALQQVKERSMPPEDEKQPGDADRAALAAGIEAALDRALERAPRDPGRTVLHRLNRAEYDNTIRDLVGIDLRPAEDFPLDDVGEGFDNVADVLTLPPILLDKYLSAAERVLDRVVVAEGPAALLERKADGASLPLEKELAVPLDVPVDGRYEIRVGARQESGIDGAAALGFRIDGVDMEALRVESPGTFVASFPIRAGARKLSLRHLPPRALRDKEKAPPEARLVVDRVEVGGPERSLAHRRLFAPANGETREDAKAVIAAFAARAFRRPPAADEVERLLALHDAARKEGKPFAAAVRRSLWAVLVSPRFLFRVEGAGRLDDWAIASRLSYFLWSSMPDAALFDLAAKGRLREPAVLKEQVKRMLADARSDALVENFAGQWLGLRRLEHVQPDRERFPSWGEELRRAMGDEVRALVRHVVREDRPVLELLDADYAFLNEALARHYGIKGVKGDKLRRVELADRRRGGVLTSAAVLTITSHPTRTSAVKRGKWVLDEILGAPPPPPPPDVPELDAASKDRPDASTLSLRQRLEIHRDNPRCVGCHKRMDAIGLGLENFDPLGRWRDQEGGKKIDASGTLPGGETFGGPADLKKILAACRDDFARTVTEKTLVYALGRALQFTDRGEVKRIVAELQSKDYRFSALVEGVVMAYAFQHRAEAR